MLKKHFFVKVGMVGTICFVSDSQMTLGVCFDQKFVGGHNLSGRCPEGRGHWIPPNYVEKINKEIDNFDIEIKNVTNDQFIY